MCATTADRRLLESGAGRGSRPKPESTGPDRFILPQDMEICTMVSSNGANPNVLVSTEWVAGHLDDPNVRLVESNEDVSLYATGHIPGAVLIDWHTDQQDPVIRDFITCEQFEQLMESRGIGNDTTVVFYGDRNNWYAAYTCWLFKLYGHADCRIMDGGRAKWEQEGRPLTQDVPDLPQTEYMAQDADLSIRAFRDEVVSHMQGGNPLVDVRGPDEYTGKVIAMPSYPQEGAQRGGHIPTAVNIPWATAANEDGTFKDVNELTAIYRGKGITPERPIITYCRIGERAAHTWFVLTQLLGYPDVRNYDGSWTEWGSLVRAPIVKGESAG
jgi:thiosulfate/3-mercaptopyruvate sulfurtransferase